MGKRWCVPPTQNFHICCCEERDAFLSWANNRRAGPVGHHLDRNNPSSGPFPLVSTPRHSQKPIIAIVGPTASGKSELAIELAVRLGGEIINCDSVQVYREIEIATAKAPLAERRGVPHHLIDFVPPEVNYTAGEWARDASQKIEEIDSRDKVALLVGGTGFYLRALREPFFPSPTTDPDLRCRVSAIRERRGQLHLHRMLQRLDPASAAKLFEADWPRVQRAIEVRLQTGIRLSDLAPARAESTIPASRLRLFALNPPRSELYARINSRTDDHFAAGLVDEVRRLLDKGVPPESNALGAHGYRRVVEYLQGQRTLESAIEQTKLNVRHYAKRQLTWFRREAGVEWLEGFGSDRAVIEQVLKALENDA